MHWLHIHPNYLVGPGEWELVRLAASWRDGRLPEPGGVNNQAAFTVAAIEMVLNAWSKMRIALEAKTKDS